MEIVHFEKSKIITNLEVKAYLCTRFPSQHIEKIIQVKYTDTYMEYKGPQPQGIPPAYIKNTLGECEFDKDKNGYLIRVYRQLPDGSRDSEGIKITVAHEVAHVVYAELSQEYTQQWSQLDKSIVRLRPRLTTEENFIEHYLAYMKSPDYVIENFPDEYNFMCDKVFGGREYIT